MWVAQGTRCPRCKRKVAGFRGLFSCARCARRICAQCLGAARDFDVPPFREYLCPDCKKPSHRGQQELLERIRADHHRSCCREPEPRTAVSRAARTANATVAPPTSKSCREGC